MKIYEHSNLQVTVVKEGHVYTISGEEQELATINFQDGPVKEIGINGIQNEPLIAILIDRITMLNTLFPCPENLLALKHLGEALEALEFRTKNRIARGVEDQNII